MPKMWGFQAAGAAPIVSAIRSPNPETIADRDSHRNPASWIPRLGGDPRVHSAQSARLTDDEILEAYRYVARFTSRSSVEPASAASIAGIIKYGVPKDRRVVCVLHRQRTEGPRTTRGRDERSRRRGRRGIESFASAKLS